MAELVTLAAARSHLRVGTEVSDADLAELIAGAAAMIEERMQRPIEGEGGFADGAIPAGVTMAIKYAMLVLYDNPGAPALDDAVLLSMVGRYCKPSMG